MFTMNQKRINKRKYRRYSYELKKKVVELYSEGRSPKELAKSYNIKHSRRIYEWVKIVREHGYEALQNGFPRSTKQKIEKQKLELERENTRLKLENEFLKKLIALERR